MVEHWTFNPGVQGSNPCGVAFLITFAEYLFMKINSNIKKLIESNIICLSTSNNDCPHTIYVSEVKIRNNELIITDNFMKKSIQNILVNPNVALAFFKDGKGLELIGVAKYFSDGFFLNFVKKIPENKGLPAKGAVVIRISEIKGMH